MMPDQGYKRGLFENNSIVRIDHEDFKGQNIAVEDHQSIKTFARTETKKSESSVDNRVGSKRRKLINVKSINSSSDQGKRSFYSEGKDKMETIWNSK